MLFVFEREREKRAECGLSTQLKTKIVAFILWSPLLLLLSFMFHFLVIVFFSVARLNTLLLKSSRPSQMIDIK